MYSFISPFNNAAYNLALEEYLFCSNDDFIVLYINSPSIIIGRNQLIYKEINYLRCINDGIPIFRRMSGGGTVFHGYGNINYAIIKTFTAEVRPGYEEMTKPIIDFLSENNIYAFLRDSSNIFALPMENASSNTIIKTNNTNQIGKKISGNAQHIHRKRMIHHGTLLFNEDLEKLKLYLNPEIKYNTKAVNSRPAETENILNLLKSKVSISEFIERLLIFINYSYNATNYCLSEELINNIINKSQKYNSLEWLYGNNPSYILDKPIDSVILHLEVLKGLITNATLNNEELPIIGCYHAYESLKEFTPKQHQNLTITSLF